MYEGLQHITNKVDMNPFENRLEKFKQIIALWINSLLFHYTLIHGLEVVDERIIRRSELLLSLNFVNGYDIELESMNYSRVGRPFRFTNTYITLLNVASCSRCLTGSLKGLREH